MTTDRWFTVTCGSSTWIVPQSEVAFADPLQHARIFPPLTEVILLGTLAIRTGKSVKTDGDATRIVSNPKAAALVKVEARRGWDVTDLS